MSVFVVDGYGVWTHVNSGRRFVPQVQLGDFKIDADAETGKVRVVAKCTNSIVELKPKEKPRDEHRHTDDGAASGS